MAGTLRAVVIGTGFGARVVAPIYERLGIAYTIISPHDMPGIRAAVAEAVDLVSVHSPPFLHHDHVMAALDHGRAVLCDKPFGRDAKEARAIRDRAEALGVPHFLNFEFREQPGRVRLKALLDADAIGTLIHISWTMIGAGLRGQRHRWLFDDAQGGGWIGAFGSHVIDTLRFLTGGEITRCGGISRIEIKTRPDKAGVIHPSTAEDAFTAWMLTDNGVSIAFDTAFSAPAFLPQRLILTGETGVVELVDDLTLTIRRPGVAIETITIDPPTPGGEQHDPALLPWLTKVRDALRSGERIAPNFNDGIACADVMDALRANLVRAS